MVADEQVGRLQKEAGLPSPRFVPKMRGHEQDTDLAVRGPVGRAADGGMQRFAGRFASTALELGEDRTGTAGLGRHSRQDDIAAGLTRVDAGSGICRVRGRPGRGPFGGLCGEAGFRRGRGARGFTVERGGFRS